MIIEKPLNYIREFYGGILNNKIKYCIIKDSNIDYSCVACCVGVGSNKDPKKYQGLAHFLEHMLFLGSKKYTNPEYFNEYITQNGGFTNAYTSFMETNYYYKINNNALEKSMDIFSRFFIDPLFDKKLVDREVNAVDSEHNKNINNDFWLIRQVILNLSNSDSVINSFSTGNNETLNKKETRDEMIKFFNKYYCSDNITITVLSPNNINDIEKIIKNTFGNIPKKNYIKDDTLDMPKYNIKNKEYQLFPVNNSNEFNIVYFWDINYEQYYKNDKSIYILSDIINDFNNGGYYHYLKSNGYIHSLSSIINDEGVFFIIINVNKEKDNIINLIKEINNITKNFLSTLKNKDGSKLYNYHSKKYELNYKYGNKEDGIDMVQDICVNMLNYDISNYYNGNKIVIKKDINKFKKTINQLDFNNVNILYYTKEDLGIKNKIFEKYYKAYYGELNKKLLSNGKNNNIKLNIINSNKYFDMNPVLIKNLDRFEIPSLYNKRQWYGGVSRFNEYNVIGKLVLSNSSLFSNIDNFISTVISISIINYYLNLEFSDLIDIGFYAHFATNSYLSNIILTINGLNDKYNNFFYDVLKYLKTIKPESNIINNYINTTIIEYENIKTSSLSSYMSLLIQYMTNNNIYHFEEILKTLKNNNFKSQIKKRINSIINFNNLSLYTLFYGNISGNNLPDTSNFIKNYNLEKIPIPKPNLIKSKRYKKLNPNDKDILIIYSYFCSDFNPLNIVKTLILYNLIDNESYTYLRTNEQLGYNVGSTIKKINNNFYLMIKVQSSKKENYVKDKIDNFIEYFKNYFIKKVNNKKEFENIKLNVKKLINLESNSTNEIFSKYFYEILIDRYFFNKDIILTNQLEKITSKDMIEFSTSLFKKKEVLVIN
jgi:insulysin